MSYWWPKAALSIPDTLKFFGIALIQSSSLNYLTPMIYNSHLLSWLMLKLSISMWPVEFLHTEGNGFLHWHMTANYISIWHQQCRAVFWGYFISICSTGERADTIGEVQDYGCFKKSGCLCVPITEMLLVIIILLYYYISATTVALDTDNLESFYLIIAERKWFSFYTLHLHRLTLN